MGKQPLRATIAFVVLFALYQSAEGVGGKLLGSFAVQAGLMIACVVAAWPLSRWLGFRGYGAYALDLRASSFAWLGAGLLLAIGAKAAAIGFGLQSGVLQQEAPPSPWLAALPMLLVSTCVPSIAEDILTRGFWYRASGIRWRRGVAFVAFATIVYVLNHVYRLAEGPMEWMRLACFGIAYAIALWRTGSLWAAVGLHWGWNLANGVFAIAWPTVAIDATTSTVFSCLAHLAMALVVFAATIRTQRAVDQAAEEGG